MIRYVVDGLVNGSIIALGAVGLSITYNVLRFANFAQGEILAIGAYMSMALIVLMGVGIGSIGPVSFGWPLLVSIAFSGPTANVHQPSLLVIGLIFVQN